MRKYPLNKEKSKQVYSKRMTMKECCGNVFKAVTENYSKFSNGDWYVAYGYMTVFDNLLCRHCFILDEHNNVLDPTLFTTERGNTKEKEYYVSYVFEKIDEYHKAIEQEHCYPALCRYLKDYDNKAQEWAKQNGYILIQ